jgi:glycosyltransferase involved in cell wall biosynthesis
MRTIIHFIDNLQAGGKERQCVELVRALAARGDTRCIVVTMSEALFFTELLAMPGVKVEFLIRRSRLDLRVVWHFVSLCRRWRPDLIHVWHVMCALVAIPAALLMRVPVLASFIQDAPEPVPPKLARRAKLACTFAEVVVANSHAGLRAYAPSAAKSEVIPSGFDVARFDQAWDAGWLRREFGLGQALVVGMVATFSAYKDQPTLIEAARLVLSRRDDVVFVLVGGGLTLDDCRALVPPGLASRIQLPGRVEMAVEQIVSGFDIAVLATFTEGVSNSLAEAMMLRKPVVATACAGNAELVIPDRTGWLVPPRDPAALADAVMRLLDDHALRHRFGAAGRADIEHRLAMPHIVARFGAIYDRLIAPR